MASAAVIDRRTRCGAVVTRGILVTVHDLYGGRLPLLPLEFYFKLRRHHDVQPFRFRPRTQTLETSGKDDDGAINFVTHGYGALVLREAFRYVDWNYTKSKVVMLAPPNRGIRYYAAMKKHVGIAGYGGVAAEELATLTDESLDLRLGKLPRRCYPLVLSGSLSLNPFNQANYPNDGTVTVEETTLPGEFRHQVLPVSHYLLPAHPTAIYLARSFLEA
ncbi:hypothetical protein PybrP1_006899 [[Pythium] brassicae (nom. inval.)]|nr:hypothetical protein PybrP1_006899 [[Pythium] brassicae (nom. inval.)]